MVANACDGLVRTSATMPPVPEETTHVTIGMSQTAVMEDRSVCFSDNMLGFRLATAFPKEMKDQKVTLELTARRAMKAHT